MTANKSRDPLLYIHQPDWEFPETEMQDMYLIKREQEKETSVNEFEGDNQSQEDEICVVESLSEENNEQINTQQFIDNQEDNPTAVNETTEKLIQERSEKQEIVNSLEVQKVIEQFEMEREIKSQAPNQPENIGRTTSFKRKKGFREMNILEKVDYLVNFPKLLPPVPCVFMTSEETIKGFLISVAEDILTVKLFDEKNIEIHIDQLKEIKIIGFK